MVCLDTSVVIDYAYGKEKVVRLVDEYVSRGTLYITTITKYELLKHSDEIKRSVAELIISKFLIYDFDVESADHSAKIFRDLKTSGKMINENDILIAGVVASQEDLLITVDSKFKNIKDLKVLVV